jgi:hypothetical protein
MLTCGSLHIYVVPYVVNLSPLIRHRIGNYSLLVQGTKQTQRAGGAVRHSLIGPAGIIAH